MKRSAFKRKPPAPYVRPERVRAPLVRALEPRAATMTSTSMRAPVEKHVYVRSELLMANYRLIPCQHCGANDGTVCGAHSNWSIHGKGRSIKADDNRCASLCFRCHSRLDQGTDMTDTERWRFWFDAHVSTVVLLVRLVLWPASVPVPDLTDPFR